ncbi:hypothetical protein HU200_028006 [Digitaria exilis]|uniref:Uncharacterized protein n=1 Tax=Digitaria exilis TaxID=1010633 RepID=A0A835EW16_9POAL|nr:hypothetical protein HU200_028006 [Digitaria exilis]
MTSYIGSLVCLKHHHRAPLAYTHLSFW